MNKKIIEKKQKSKNFMKSYIIITIIFFIISSYVTFFIDNPNHDGDILFYFYSGKEIIYGDPQNVIIFNAPVGWPILLATVDSVINDPHITAKIFSVIFASGIVLTSYFIIKNIFDKKVAALGQLLIAISPMLHVEAINSHSEMLPIFLIFLAFYFITKKQLVQKDITYCALFLGLSFMLRPQALFIAFGVIGFILFFIKKTKKRFLLYFILTFVICISPLLVYNIATSGNLIDNDPNFYLSKESANNKKNYEKLMEQDTIITSQRNENIKLTMMFSEYANNLIYNNPHYILNLGTGHNNFSVFPLIPFSGILFTLGGIVCIFPNNFKRIHIAYILGVSISLFTILLITNNIEKYFLVPIVIPIIIIGIISFKKIDPNILALLIISSTFMIFISIINVKTPHDIGALSIIPITFSSYFIIKIIPKILTKILKDKIIKYFLILIVILIIVMNITLSVMVQENMLFGENIDYKNLIKEKEYKHTGIEYKEVGMYLAGEENIQNKIIMANERDFAHYAKSKFVWTTFNEGEQDDTINEFLNRENWSKYEIIESNMASQPPDRRDKDNHIPDYIIIQKNIDMKNSMNVFKNQNDPKIPTNIKLIYESISNKTLVYKINEK